jgi:site-specific DNA-cytosine methylase
MKHVRYHNPKADFLIENVKMKKEFEEYITTHTESALGNVHKILINSALVSAQNRNRYYWTSFEVKQPEDKGILLNDIIEKDCLYVNSDGWHKWWEGKKEFQIKKKYSAICNDSSTDKAICMTARQYASWNGNYVVRATVQKNAEHTYDGKCPTITASMGIGGGNVPLMTDNKTAEKFKGMYIDKYDRLQYRKLTPRECFRLQTVPEHHIDTLLSAGISNTQLYKMCGNGWTMEVIAHIFNCMSNV